MSHSRILIERRPFIAREDEGQWLYGGRGHWPTRWIESPEAVAAPYVAAYRLRFEVTGAVKVRVHVSADERYALFLDGQMVGTGPEMGDRDHWFFDSYELELETGKHVLVARVAVLGEFAEIAQMSVKPGFLLAPEGDEWLDRLGTGWAEWEVQILHGLSFSAPRVPGYYAGGPVAEVDANAFPWGYEKGEGEGWQKAKTGAPAIDARFATESPMVHCLRPSTLPAQFEGKFRPASVRWVADAEPEEPVSVANHLGEEAVVWKGLLWDDKPLRIESGTRRRVLIDLGNYYCAFSRLKVSGGAGSSVTLKWAEALYEDAEWTRKGHRDEVEGGFFVGIGDTLRLDGGQNRIWEPLEWSAGRYVEVQIKTGDEALTIENLRWRESRYALELEGELASSDEELQQVWPILTRGVQMCAHQTYMDCPFYERLMYAGDTRLQMLASFVMTRDDALPRRALESFAWSRVSGETIEGLTQSRYPSRLRQIIPPFSLWWATMLHDFAMWRGDRAFVGELMPIARGVLEGMERFCNADGLLEAPNGWNFVDWVPEWKHGVPPEGVQGVSGPVNWTYLHALRAMEELERWQEEPELAGRWGRHAGRVLEALELFWDENRGLFADDRGHQYFSEHSNALALAGGFLSAERAVRVTDAMENAPNLARTTIYFSHYLLEAWQRMERPGAFWRKMDLWRDLPRQGFVTPFESSDWRSTRSDCHGWGSHPLFHFYASVLGVRPAGFGFEQVQIFPQLGPLRWARGRIPHPLGFIRADFSREGEGVVGVVSLPEGVEVVEVPAGVRVERL